MRPAALQGFAERSQVFQGVSGRFKGFPRNFRGFAGLQVIFKGISGVFRDVQGSRSILGGLHRISSVLERTLRKKI